MNKIFTSAELFRLNIVSVKIIKDKRKYSQTIGPDVIKMINRTRYLKLCWFCGGPYESSKFNSFACSKGCSQNLVRQRKAGYNPPFDVLELIKPRNIKDIKAEFEYR